MMYMELNTGMTGKYDDWYYVDEESGKMVNAVDLNEVVLVEEAPRVILCIYNESLEAVVVFERESEYFCELAAAEAGYDDYEKYGWTYCIDSVDLTEDTRYL